MIAAIRCGCVWALLAAARHHDVIRPMSEHGVPASDTRDQALRKSASTA